MVQVKGDVSEAAVSDFLESLNQFVTSETWASHGGIGLPARIKI